MVLLIVIAYHLEDFPTLFVNTYFISPVQGHLHSLMSVSYTHLDVYKRQVYNKRISYIFVVL